MRVLLFSKYGELGASSRVRFLQYLPYFRSQGLDVTTSILFSDEYVSAMYHKKPIWREVFVGYCRRFKSILTVYKYDIVIIEKELFPFFPPIFELIFKILGIKYLVDYDDALFHKYDCHKNRLIRTLLGKKIDAVMRYSNVVTAGNSYLADRAISSGAPKVTIIPTVVDQNRFTNISNHKNDSMIVGWIGTPQTSKYLEFLLPIFEKLKRVYDVHFVAVGARAEDFLDSAVETWEWSEKTEAALVQRFDIGIMPLPDSPWERGKCGYKLIQYMSCGIPVIGSPVGVNCDLVKNGINGYLANTSEEWELALETLIRAEKVVRHNMGQIGRKMVEKWYSIDVQKARILRVIYESGC